MDLTKSFDYSIGESVEIQTPNIVSIKENIDNAISPLLEGSIKDKDKPFLMQRNKELDAQIYETENEHIDLVIEKYISHNPQLYELLNTLGTPPSIEALLEISNNIVWNCTGQHDDKANHQNRNIQEFFVFPEKDIKPDVVNCGLFNKLYKRTFENLSRKYNPNILNNFRLIDVIAEYAEDLGRAYENNGFYQHHGYLMLMSSDGKNINLSALDPYHVLGIENSFHLNKLGSSIDRLDYTNIRYLDCVNTYISKFFRSANMGNNPRNIILNISKIVESLENLNENDKIIVKLRTNETILSMQNGWIRDATSAINNILESISSTYSDDILEMNIFDPIKQGIRKAKDGDESKQFNEATENITQLTDNITSVMKRIGEEVKLVRTTIIDFTTQTSRDYLDFISQNELDDRTLTAGYDYFNLLFLKTGSISELSRFNSIVTPSSVVKADENPGMSRKFYRRLKDESLVIPENITEAQFEAWKTMLFGVRRIAKQKGYTVNLKIQNLNHPFAQRLLDEYDELAA